VRVKAGSASDCLLDQTGPLTYKGPSQRTKAGTSSVRMTHSWSAGAIPMTVAKKRRAAPSLGYSVKRVACPRGRRPLLAERRRESSRAR